MIEYFLFVPFVQYSGCVYMASRFLSLSLSFLEVTASQSAHI